MLRSTWKIFLSVLSVRNKKLFALRAVLFLTPCIGTAVGTYFYMMQLAVAHTPPEGYIFPRESVLIGTYRYEAPGGKAYRSKVDETSIQCGWFTYYAATLAQVGGHGDCGRKQELNGKPVEVHRARVPTFNPESTSPVIRIVSNGKVYLDRSDAWIRERWIRDTEESAIFAAESLCLFVGMFSWLAADWITKRIEQRGVMQ